MRLITVKSLFNEVSRDFDRNEMCERFSRRILVDCGTGVVLADDFCLETVTFRPKSRDDIIVAIYSNREQATRRDFPKKNGVLASEIKI